MAPIVIVALAVGGYLLWHHEHPTSVRRKVAGKSGTAWYVAALPSDSMNTTVSAVYSAATGEDLVLQYRQVTGPTAGANIGDRFIEYQAPTTLTQKAISDFGPFVNQGKTQ